MIITRQKEDGRYETFSIDGEFGVTDYVKGGKVYTHVPIRTVMVADENDLDLLTNYEAGAIAFTAGYKDMWQKGTDGTWTSLL